MSETITLELAQATSNQVVNNGDYYVKLADPIEINAGDSVNLRLASIDTLKADNDVIVIEDDTEFSITYSIYDVDYMHPTDFGKATAAGQILNNKSQYNANPAEFWMSTNQSNPADAAPGPTYEKACLYWKPWMETYNESTNPWRLKFSNYVEPQYFDAVAIGGTSYVNGTYVVKAGMKDVSFNNGNPVNAKGIELLVTVEYLDVSGNTKTCRFTGTNATYGTVPQNGGPANPGAPFVDWHATGPEVQLEAVDAMESFATGSVIITKVEGSYPGGTSPFGGHGSTPGPLGDWTVQGQIGRNPQNIAIQTKDLELETESAGTSFSSDLHLLVRKQQFLLRRGTYNPTAFANALTEAINSAEGLSDEQDSGNNQIVSPNSQFLQLLNQEPLTNPNINDTTNARYCLRICDFSSNETTIVFDNNNSYCYDNPTYIGATQTTIEYGSAGETFSVPYLHTPLQDDTHPEQVWISQNQNTAGEERYYLSKAACGIAIHDLQPQNLWDNILGIRDALIINLQTDDNGVKYLNTADLEAHITEGYAARSIFLGNVATPSDPRRAPSGWANGQVNSFNIDGETKSIIGQTRSFDSTGGLYLLRISGLTPRRGGYVDNEQMQGNIQAVISTQFDSQNRITGFGDSGIQYVHEGNSYFISNPHVEIIDKTTNLLAEDLGPDTVIVIDVIKGIQPTDVPVPPILPAGRTSQR